MNGQAAQFKHYVKARGADAAGDFQKYFQAPEKKGNASVGFLGGDGGGAVGYCFFLGGGGEGGGGVGGEGERGGRRGGEGGRRQKQQLADGVFSAFWTLNVRATKSPKDLKSRGRRGLEV